MPTNIATQTVHIIQISTGLQIYQGTCDRDAVVYPLTTAGQAAFEAAVAAGSHLGITLPNGVVIPAGTVPPLVMPVPPPTGIPAFYLKLQSEDSVVSGTGTFDGSVGDNHWIGGMLNASQYRLYTIPGVIGAASNYDLALHYSTNISVGGHGSVIVNGGSPIEFITEGADGGTRTVHLTIALTPGTNTIRIEGKDGQPFYQDWIIVSRDATE